MKPGRLPENATARRKLQARLDELKVKFPNGSSTSTIMTGISGKWFEFSENDRGIKAVAFDFNSPTPTLIVRSVAGETRLPFGINSWVKSRGTFTNGLDHFLSVPANPLVASSGAWAADNTLTVKLVLYETPFYSTVNFKFDSDRLTVDAEHNVAFGTTKVSQLVGQLRETN
jgi:hypothetical protein